MSTKAKAYIALFCTSFFWGLSWIFSRIGAHEMPPLELAAYRQSIAGLIFVGFFFIKGEKLPRGKQLVQFLIFAILLFVMSNGLATWSVQYLPAGLGALIGALYPICVVLIEAAFFGKRNLRMLTIIGLVLGFLGIGLVFYDNIFTGAVLPEGFGLGLILAFIAVLSWAIGTIYIARGNDKEGPKQNPYYAIGWQMLLGGLMLFVVSLLKGDMIAVTKISWISWRSIIYLVTFGSLLTFVAFIYTMKHLPVAVASIYAYINPIVALTVSALWRHDEHLTVKNVLGFAITLAGVFMVNYSVRKEVKEKTEG